MSLDGFKNYFEQKENGDVKKLLEKIPKGHKKLTHGVKFNYTGNNTLNGDKKHVGVFHKNKITVAAPWNYSREFTTLHEIAHIVWENKMTPELKKKWSSLVKSAKKGLKRKDIAFSSLNQNMEEIFAMCYANYYAKHKILTYYHPKWMKFIASLPD